MNPGSTLHASPAQAWKSRRFDPHLRRLRGPTWGSASWSSGACARGASPSAPTPRKKRERDFHPMGPEVIFHFCSIRFVVGFCSLLVFCVIYFRDATRYPRNPPPQDFLWVSVAPDGTRKQKVLTFWGHDETWTKKGKPRGQKVGRTPPHFSVSLMVIVMVPFMLWTKPVSHHEMKPGLKL